MNLFGFFYALAIGIFRSDFAAFSVNVSKTPADVGLADLFNDLIRQLPYFGTGQFSSDVVANCDLLDLTAGVIALVLSILFVVWLVRLVVGIFTLNRWR